MYLLTSITWPYRGLKLKAHRGQLFFFVKLTADQVLVFDWIAGSTQVNSPKHIKQGFIFCALSVAQLGYTAILHQLQRIVLTESMLFVFMWKTVWKVFSFCIFDWFQSSLTYHDSFGPHWRLRRYSSRELEGYKLKAECLFSICLELPFSSLYCNFWHIFRSSDKVTRYLEDLWLAQKRKESERERQRQSRIPVMAHS